MKSICSVLSFGDHGSTFGGNPMACAVVSGVLSRLTSDFLSSIHDKGKIFDGCLTSIKATIWIGRHC